MSADGRAFELKQSLTLDTTGTSYSDVFNFSGYNYAQQLELKVDVTAGDGSCDFQIEVSDDGVTWFEVDMATFTIAAVGKDGLIIDAQGNYMRVALDYTHGTVDTVMEIFNLVR